MRNYIMATSVAIILPALSACSYMPGFMQDGFKSDHNQSYHSGAYSTAHHQSGLSHDLGSSQGYQAQSLQNHGYNSYQAQPISVQSGCHHQAVQPSIQYQMQPCGSSYTQHAVAPSYASNTQSYQATSICGPVGCAPQDSYSVAGNHHVTPELRGSYKSNYIYSNIGGVAYDAGGDLFGVVGRLGYQSDSFLGAEAEGTIGVNNTTIEEAGITISGGVDYSVAAFALARLPVSDKFALHARGGYHVTRVSAEADDGTAMISNAEAFDGFAYGAGAEFNVSERDSIRVDYTRYEYDAQDPNIDNVASQDTVSVAYARKF